MRLLGGNALEDAGISGRQVSAHTKLVRAERVERRRLPDGHLSHADLSARLDVHPKDLHGVRKVVRKGDFGLDLGTRRRARSWDGVQVVAGVRDGAQ